MNNIENNRIIARFMGFESYPFENKGGKGFDVTLNGVPKDDCNGSYSCACYGDLEYNIEQILSRELKYHKCWNWLMEVVEKIETLFNDGIDVDIFSDGTVITQYRFEENEYLTEGEEIVRLTKAEIGFDTKIEHTYQAVVEFIKWYNSAKENTTDQLSNRDLGQSTII
jgi:hypothetical protein